MQAAVDAADGCRAGAGNIQNVIVNLTLAQKSCHLKALLHGLHFRHGAQVTEKAVAFLMGLQLQNRIIELMLRVRLFISIIQGFTPPDHILTY